MRLAHVQGTVVRAHGPTAGLVQVRGTEYKCKAQRRGECMWGAGVRGPTASLRAYGVRGTDVGRNDGADASSHANMVRSGPTAGLTPSGYEERALRRGSCLKACIGKAPQEGKQSKKGS
jgi:hypothetical protein